MDAPLYNKYPQQSTPQGAYLTINPENCDTSWDSDPEIGGAVSAVVWHGREIRISCSPYLSQQQIDAATEEYALLIERICAGYTCDWNGSNHVGILDADAEAAQCELESLLAQIEGEVQVWDAGDWLAPLGSTGRMWYILCEEAKASQVEESIDTVVEWVESEADGEGVVLDDVEGTVRYYYEQRDEVVDT